MSADALLSVRGLAVTRGGRRLFDGFDLDLHPGECVALRAPSGGGKSSLLRVLCGLDDAVAGEVLLGGATPGAIGWPMFRRRVQLVAQEPVLPAGTVGEALARPFHYAAAEADFAPEAAEALLAALFDAPPALDRQTTALSVGERQRVALVRALLAAPPILLLDEPTSALDPEATAKVEAAVSRHLRTAGAGALVVSHDPEQASRWCDRVIATGGAE
jgi:ABC-type iron transport system FetAB ATPase subunit